MAFGNPHDPLAGGVMADTDQVARIEPTDTDPSWAKVTFADGRTETRPTAEAEALPQVQPQSAEFQGLPEYPVGVMPQGGEFEGLPGAPPAPVGPGQAPVIDPQTQAYLSQSQAEGFRPVGQVDPATNPNLAPAGPLVNHGEAYRPAGTPPSIGLNVNTAGGPGELPPAQVDPGAAVVAPGGAAAPGATTGMTGVENTTYAQDPAQAGQAANAAYGDIASELQATEANRLQAERAENASLLKSNEAAQAAYNQQVRKAEIFTEESKKALQAVEDHPIEEDFFKDAPGRQAAAWIALALSGFLQGATKGANPALNQMMQSLNGAQERFIANQRADKNSKLQLRREALGDAKAAESSIRMQLPALMEKYANLQARQVGLNEMTPGLSTAVAAMKVKGVEAGQHFASLPVQRTEARMTQEQHAAGPQYAGDRELAALGVSPEVHRKEAMAPDKANLGGRIDVSERLNKIKTELQAIVQKHGELPHNELISWGPARALGARLGVGDAPDEVRGKQLIEELKSLVAQGGNVKLYDSVQDQERLNNIIDTGSAKQTMQAVDSLLEKNNRQTIATASAFTRNPQGYIDFIRRTMTQNPGVVGEAGEAPKPKRSTGFRVDAPKATEESTLRANAPAAAAPTGGGPAPSPLAPGPTTGSRPGSYQRQPKSNP